MYVVITMAISILLLQWIFPPGSLNTSSRRMYCSILNKPASLASHIPYICINVCICANEDDCINAAVFDPLPILFLRINLNQIHFHCIIFSFTIVSCECRIRMQIHPISNTILEQYHSVQFCPFSTHLFPYPTFKWNILNKHICKVVKRCIIPSNHITFQLVALL